MIWKEGYKQFDRFEIQYRSKNPVAVIVNQVVEFNNKKVVESSKREATF